MPLSIAVKIPLQIILKVLKSSKLGSLQDRSIRFLLKNSWIFVKTSREHEHVFQAIAILRSMRQNGNILLRCCIGYCELLTEV